MRLYRILSKTIRNERGSSAVEYGMILAVVVLAMLVMLKAFADQTVGLWNDVAMKTTVATSKN